MYGYKLQKPKAIPKIAWACKSKVEQYSWNNRNKADMIEFAICYSKKRTIVFGDSLPEHTEGDAFYCILGDERCQSYADDGISVDVISVATSFEDLTYAPKQLDIDDVADTQSILLPRQLTEIPEQTMARLEKLMYQIIEVNKENCAFSEIMCAATVLQVMFELDQFVRRSLTSRKDKYVHYYVNKAESILSRRFSEHLTVKSIAEELSISPNYLSALFKSSTGIGLTDRLLEIRIKKAAELLTEKGLHESEVASLVGYEELGHFRRRFKQYYGISIRDYCCINKELTLYHQKPQKRSTH